MDKLKLIKRIIFAIILFIGLGMMVGGGIGLIYTQKMTDEYISALAKIENITQTTHRRNGKKRIHHHVFISYQAGEKRYEEELSTYSSLMKIGDEIPVIYNPQNPTEVHSPDNNRTLSIAIMISGIFLLICDVLVIPRILNRLKLKS